MQVPFTTKNPRTDHAPEQADGRNVIAENVTDERKERIALLNCLDSFASNVLVSF